MNSSLFRWRRWMVGAGLALVALAAAHAQQGAVTVTDLAGRTVQVPARVERILLGEGRLLPALAVFERDDPARRLVAMMGEFEKLDAPGYAQWARRFPQLDKVPRVGRTSSGSFSEEQAIALRPQLAILGLAGGHGPSERDRETLARLEAAGVAVVFIDLRHDPLGNTPRSMALLGEVLGRKAEADAFVKFWREQLALVTGRLARARPEAPTVFLENRVGLSEGCCDTMVGLVGKLLDAAGSRNVAKDLIPGEFGTLNPELLIARQPRFYIGTGIGSAFLYDGALIPNTELGHLRHRALERSLTHRAGASARRIRRPHARLTPLLALGGVQLPARGVISPGTEVHARVTGIATKRTSGCLTWSVGPSVAAYEFWPRYGGNEYGVWLGGFANLAWQWSEHWTLVPEVSLHRAVSGTFPVDKSIAELSIGWSRTW